MTRIEMQYNAAKKELEKAEARLARTSKAYAKKLENAKRLGVAEMDHEQHLAWTRTLETKEGWLVNKADIEKNGAWFDLFSAERDWKEANENLDRASVKLLKLEAMVKPIISAGEETTTERKQETAISFNRMAHDGRRTGHKAENLASMKRDFQKVIKAIRGSENEYPKAMMTSQQEANRTATVNCGGEWRKAEKAKAMAEMVMQDERFIAWLDKWGAEAHIENAAYTNFQIRINY